MYIDQLMDIFGLILNHCFSTVPPDYEEECHDAIVKRGVLNYVFSRRYAARHGTAGSLSDILDRVIMKSAFIESPLKDYLFKMYGMAMRRYLTLLRFRRKLQFVYCRRYDVDTDLHLNPLSDLPDHLKLSIIENQTKYTFRLSDLGNIIQSSLSAGGELMPTPQWPRNPYTNAPFSKTTLIIVHMALRASRYRIPTLLHLFADVDYDLSLFEMRYEGILKEYAIVYFLRNAGTARLYESIREMFAAYESDLKELRVHPTFPHESVVVALKDTLGLFLRAKYACSFFERAAYRHRTKKSLLTFVRLNPTWGRLIIVQPQVTEAERRMCLRNYSVLLVSEHNARTVDGSLDGRYIDVVYTHETKRQPSCHRRFRTRRQRNRNPDVEHLALED